MEVFPRVRDILMGIDISSCPLHTFEVRGLVEVKILKLGMVHVPLGNAVMSVCSRREAAPIHSRDDRHCIDHGSCQEPVLAVVHKYCAPVPRLVRRSRCAGR